MEPVRTASPHGWVGHSRSPPPTSHDVAGELQPVGEPAQVDFRHDENIMRAGNMSYMARGKCCAFTFRAWLFLDQQNPSSC